MMVVTQVLLFVLVVFTMFVSFGEISSAVTILSSFLLSYLKLLKALFSPLFLYCRFFLLFIILIALML